jgi:hypothetical protein
LNSLLARSSMVNSPPCWKASMHILCIRCWRSAWTPFVPV